MEIKNRWNNDIIITDKYANIKEAVEKNKKNLSGAYLSGAYLRGADLSDADLSDADLRDADLRGAYLSDADLSDADLRGADLSDADLSGAYLSDADLSGADLRGAYLSDADLSGADLRGADLSGADLRGAQGLVFLIPYTLNDFIKEYKVKKRGNYIYVFKGVTQELQSPMSDIKLKYDIGSTIVVDKANPDYFTICSYGIHLCPTIEAAREFGSTIIECKVHIGDIVVIPVEHNKFRVRKCTVERIVES